MTLRKSEGKVTQVMLVHEYLPTEYLMGEEKREMNILFSSTLKIFGKSNRETGLVSNYWL